jgi:hypothetical protein
MKNLILIVTKIKSICGDICDSVNKIHSMIILIIALVLLIGHFVRPLFSNKMPPNVAVSVQVNGNIIKVPLLSVLTNTSNINVLITNFLPVYTDDTNYNLDPFKFTQTNDILTAELYKRYASYKIKQWYQEKHLMIGGSIYENNNGQAYGPLIGYEFEYAGAILQPYFGQTNNYGVSLSGFLRF